MLLFKFGCWPANFVVFWQLLYVDVTIVQIHVYDEAFDSDPIIKKFANRCDVGAFGKRSVGISVYITVHINLPISPILAKANKSILKRWLERTSQDCAFLGTTVLFYLLTLKFHSFSTTWPWPLFLWYQWSRVPLRNHFDYLSVTFCFCWHFMCSLTTYLT